MKDLSQHLLPLHKDLLQKYLTLVDLKSQCPMLTFSQRISGDKYHSELKRKKVNANHCHIHCMMTFRLLKQYNQPSYQIYHLSHYDLLHFNKIIYYSTMMSFYHIWSRERAKYETVIHCSVPVWPVLEQSKYGRKRQFFSERNCFHRDTKPENLACHRLPLVISFIQSNKGC